MGCKWQLDHEDDNVWETGCGGMHTFFVGDPEFNLYKFCPYCGRELIYEKEKTEG